MQNILLAKRPERLLAFPALTPRWPRLLALLVLLLSSAGAQAQTAATYGFTQSSGTYTPITGGTVAGTATAGSNFSLDDFNFTLAAGTIPFTFNYGGTGYTGLTINTNGYITFGATAPSVSGYTPISATTGYAGAISSFGQDLVGDATAGNLGEIRYTTVGSAPNRTFVIQYTNFKRYISSIQSDNLNFQIRLNETSNVIDLVYGAFTLSTTAGTEQVGLRGASTVYNNRTSTSSWLTTNAGTSSSASIASSATILPPAGLTYTFTPPGVCLPPTRLVASSITGAGASIAFVAPATAPTNYTVTISPAGGTATPATPTASPVVISGLTALTTYTVTLNSNCSGGTSSIPASVTFTTGPNCAPPSGLAVSSITNNTATVAFTAGFGNTSYTVTYTPAAGAASTVSPNPTASPVPLTGLAPNTTYTVSVTGNCAGSTTSAAATTTFTTLASSPPDYVISRSTGVSYSSIQTTGTSFTGWSSTSSTDDNVSGSTPIGFSFQYQGQALTNFRVSTNGWLTLNPTQVPSGTDNYSNNLSNTNANTLLAPFWEDLVLQGNAGTATALAAAKIKYQLDGTAPNRVLTVEWAEMETFNNAGPNLNFQVKLYEGSNEISYVYGNMSGFDGSADYTYSYSVGLSGALASTGQYLAQQVPNTTYFLNSNAGTANTGANALNLAPSCNSSLRFVPGTFVAGTAPTATVPTNDEPANATALALGATAPTDFCTVYTSANATATTGITACSAATPGTPDDDVWFSFVLPTTSNITVTLRSSGGYDGVQQLFSGTPGSLTAVACANATGLGLTENYTNATLAAGTYYVRVYHAGTGSGTNGSFVLAAYATPAPPANDECAGAITLTSTPTTCSPLSGTTLGATATAGVTACSASTPGTPDDDVWYKFVSASTVGTITLQGASGFDGVLQLYSGTCGTLTAQGCINGTSTGGAEVGNLTGLTPGQTYFVRVYHAGSGSGSGNFTICLVQPTCADPTALTATSITTTTASLTFTAGFGAIDYIVTYTPQGGTATTVSPAPTASPVPLTGLTPGTLYTVTLQQNCAGGQQSAVLTTTFTTATPPPANDLCSGAIAIACGQTVSGTTVNATTTGDPTASCGATPSASPSVFYSFVGTGDIVTVTTCGTTTIDTELFVYSGSCGALTCVDGNDDFSGCAANTAASSVTFTSVVGTTYYFMVQRYSSSSATGAFSLNVSCVAPPTCAAPTNVAAGTITTTSASVSFTPSASATSYTVTATPTTGPAITATGMASPIALTGLTVSTQYSLTVTSDCGGGLTAISTPAVTFTTTTPPPANDLCSGAIAIACGQTVSGTTVGATITGDPTASCGTVPSTSPSVFYSFVGTGDIVTVTTCGTTTIDTKLFVYSGSCGALTCVDGNDDFSGCAANTAASSVTFTSVVGTTYYFMVQRFGFGSTGSFSLNASCTPAPADLTVASGQNLTASGTYNNITVQTGGILTLTGNTTANGNTLVQTGGVLITNCQVLDGAGTFTLSAGAELRICAAQGIRATASTGAIQSAGTRTFSNDAIYVYNGTVAQVSGNGLPLQVRTLAVDNPTGLTLSRNVSVAQVARLTNGNLTTDGNTFTLLSSAAGTALVDNTGGSVIGTGTMQRAVTNAVTGPAYRHFSSPVQSTTLADLTTTGFSPTFNTAYNSSATPSLVTPFPTVFGYDQSRLATVTSTYGAFDKGWFSPASSGDAMQPNRGYTANAPATATPIDFVGTFNNAAQNSGSLSRGTDAAAGWQLLGNPYPAPLDWSTVAAGQRPGMDGAMYVYQSTGQYAGTYRSYDNGIGASPLIDAGSGYFTRVTTTGTPGAVNLTNANRITTFGTQPAFGRGANDTRPQLHLLLAGASLSDETYLYLEQGATAGIDAQYDATKLANPAGMDLASLSGTTPLAINGLAPLTTTDVVVPLTLRVPQAGSFSFEVGDLANFGAATVYLRDALTGTQLLLATGTRYQFALATATAGTGRFSVVFRAATVTASKVELNAASVSLYPNPSHGSFTVLLPPLAGQHEVRATLVNALGQVVLTRTIGLTAAGATAEFNTKLLATGVYTLKLQAENQALTKRVVVE